MKKPAWVIEKEKSRRTATDASVWLFGLHAVRDALCNPARTRFRLIVTKNAGDRLAAEIAASGMTPEISDPRKFSAPIDPGSVHQGAALEVRPLDWGAPDTFLAAAGPRSTVLCLDRVTDPQNAGAILRSAEVFGAKAIIAPTRHSVPETGALAKAASGALERQPYLRVRNLAAALNDLKSMGYLVVGLDSAASEDIALVVAEAGDQPIALVLGAEGPGLREKTKGTCDRLARVQYPGKFGSLNVSNAAAVALYAAARR